MNHFSILDLYLTQMVRCWETKLLNHLDSTRNNCTLIKSSGYGEDSLTRAMSTRSASSLQELTVMQHVPTLLPTRNRRSPLHRQRLSAERLPALLGSEKETVTVDAGAA